MGALHTFSVPEVMKKPTENFKQVFGTMWAHRFIFINTVAISLWFVALHVPRKVIIFMKKF